MKNPLSLLLILLLPILLLSGCIQLALRMSPSLFPNVAISIFEECDPELAEHAIPANLKLMEGLLKNDPINKQILSSLAMGFSGYSMLFVEADDPERASRLYLRAREYAVRALGNKGYDLKDPTIPKEKLQGALKKMGKEDLQALFWATMSWSAWINLNLDKPVALAQLGLSQTCLERIIELNANYFHGLPYILMGVSLSARPKMFGGNSEQAKYYFDKALNLSDGKFLLTHYYFARYYAVRVQNKKLFFDLIKKITGSNPHELKDVCLINTVIQRKAERLKKMGDELFF